jgi:toxin ParE1/3/4
MKNYKFLAEAETEYLEAIRFYEEQRSGLGNQLIYEFERAIGLILAKPDAWKLIHPSGIRFINLSRFPYAIFYRLFNGEIQITAFAHHRRRPGYWLTRNS